VRCAYGLAASEAASLRQVHGGEGDRPLMLSFACTRVPPEGHLVEAAGRTMNDIVKITGFVTSWRKP
jgi:hypothetical protein